MAKALPVLGVDPDNSIHANAALIIPVRAAELIAWERYIDDPARVAELHQMRIAAKRLRYTMELFAPFYGPEFAAAIERIKTIQEQLGQIHDADVLVPVMTAQLTAGLQAATKKRKSDETGVYCADFDAAAGLLALCRRKRDEREALYRKFLAAWKKMRANGFFESLRAMVREASKRGRGEGERGRPSVRRARPTTEGRTPNAVPGGGRNGKSEREPRAAAPARRAGGDDTGAGSDSGEGFEEGGLGQHSLFEEGDAR